MFLSDSVLQGIYDNRVCILVNGGVTLNLVEQPL